MRVLAVDFGTSNTVAAFAVDGGAPRLLAIDGSPLVPSSVFRTDDGTRAVGRDADGQARRGRRHADAGEKLSALDSWWSSRWGSS
jgi:molecular chaperone DnaK (HSP70)